MWGGGSEHRGLAKGDVAWGRWKMPSTPTTPGQREALRASWRRAGRSKIEGLGRAGTRRFCSPQAG